MLSETMTNKKTIGEYIVEGVIRRGAMGTVYRARDPNINRTVAIKTMHLAHLESGEKGEIFSRFKHEAQTAGQCQHTNIVTIYGYGEQDGIPYIVMEHIKGKDLKQLKQATKKLNIVQKLAIVAQVLKALRYAINTRLFIEISNLRILSLLPMAGFKLTDFGIACYNAIAHAQTGFIVGTPSYMSPEQIRDAQIDGRSDLFSLGVVMYELITGKKPFNGIDTEATLRSVINENPVMPSKVNSDIPEFIDRLVIKAIAKNPASRFQNADQFLTAIRGCFSQLGVEEMESSGKRRKFLADGIHNSAQYGSSQSGGEGSMQIWKPEVLQQLEDTLTHYIGPVAQTLVKKNAARHSQFDDLAGTLARHIPEDGQREKFIKSFTVNKEDKIAVEQTQWNAKEDASLKFLSEAQHRLLKDTLAFYVGPIAGKLLEIDGRQVNTKFDLVTKLAAHIPTQEERNEFISRLEAL